MRHQTGPKLDCQLRSCMRLAALLPCERSTLGCMLVAKYPRLRCPFHNPLLLTLLLILALFSSHGFTLEACLKCVTHHRIRNNT